MLKVLSPSPQHPLKFPLRLGVIDLGANSVQLLVVEIWEDCTYTQVYRDRAVIRLGSPVFGGGEIDHQTQVNAHAAIGKFLRSCQHHDVQVIRAVATSAVREASNREEFIQTVQRDFPIHLDVISGKEEARLTALAATESLGINSGRICVVDVGGGTTEIAWLEDGVSKKLWSLKLGPVRMLEHLQLEDPPGKEGLEALHQYVLKSLSPVLRAKFIRPDFALGTSGTALCLGDLCGTRGRAATSLETNVIVKPALQKLLERLSEMTLAKRRLWLGPHADRADTLLGGGMVFLTLMEEMGFDNYITGGKALREGIIIDYIQREILSSARDRNVRLAESAKMGTTPCDPRAVREQNILTLARRYHYDSDHCYQVLKISSMLFDKLYPLHLLGDEDQFYLQSAALLHDIGYHIGANDHHLHSQYLVLHSDLEGFHQMELRLIANLVRYHSKTCPSLEHAEYAAMPEPLREKVQILGGILRLADALDFTHGAMVENLELEIGEEKIVLEVSTSNGYPELEIHEASIKADLLEKALGRKLEIVCHEHKREGISGMRLVQMEKNQDSENPSPSIRVETS